jgi:hypothetical protein
MNFKTALSSTSELIFIYKSGKTRKTEFIEVSYYGDDYLLAKTQGDIYYCLLDLDGDRIEIDYKIVHRFFNGLLLTHSIHKKNIQSADKISYTINYNIYSVLNFDMDTICPINVFHREESPDAIFHETAFQNLKPVQIKNYLNKQFFQFNEFIFSEIIGERYILCCNLSLVKNASELQFDKFKSKKIWEVADVFNFDRYNNVINTNNIITGKALKETEARLLQLIESNKKSIIEKAKPSNYNIFCWAKNDWWKLTLAKLLGSKS